MNKIRTNDFPFHPYLNIIYIIIFSVLGLAGMYFFCPSLPQIVTIGEIKLYAAFIILMVAMLIFQLVRKVPYKMNFFILIIAITFYGMSLLLRYLFVKDFVFFMVAQGLAMAATLFVIMALEFAVLQLSTGTIINDGQNFVIVKKDLIVTRGSVLFFIFLVVFIPALTLEQTSFILIALWTVLIGLFAIAIGLGNYQTIIRQAIVGKEEDVLAYRSIVLYLRASQRQIHEYQERKVQIQQSIDKIAVDIENELAQKAQLEAIEDSKPQLVIEIDQLMQNMQQFDIELLRKNIVEGNQKIKIITKQIWQESFEQAYDALEENLVASKKQLDTANTELAQAKQSAEKTRDALQEVVYQLDADVETQDDLKNRRNNIVHKKDAYLDEIKNGALEEKEVKRLQAKADKLATKEDELDEKIHQLEIQISTITDKKEAFKQQVYTLTEVEIPDYQYAITSLTEKIAAVQVEKQDIEEKFTVQLNENIDYNQTKQIILAAETEEKKYNELLEQKNAKQKIVDTDCLTEIASIEENIANLKQKIQDAENDTDGLNVQHQRVNEIIEEFTKDKEQILNKLKKKA